MFAMMGGKNAQIMAEYQAAPGPHDQGGHRVCPGHPGGEDLPADGVFLQAVPAAIEEYSAKAEHYQADVCRTPQSINLSVTEGAFVFLVPAALFLAPGALATGSFAGFVTDFAFYAVFSAHHLHGAGPDHVRLLRHHAGRHRLGPHPHGHGGPGAESTRAPQGASGQRVEFRDVSFTYDGAETPALSHVSFTVEPGQTVAPGGPPSGGGKTTAASLIPRFWDVSSGAVLVGGVDVRDMDPHALMDQIAFVFQNSRLFKTSILRTSGPQGQRPPGSRCSPPSWPPSAETFWKSCQRAWTL